ncbi:MAG: hypothetical protein AABX55_01805 [Nanoarchaeota archaeon]
MKRCRWSKAEVNLLYESYRDGLSLNEFIDFIKVETGRKRTQRSIISKLLKLEKLDSYYKWHPVSSFYGKQFYKGNKARFIMWRKKHYANYREQIRSYYQNNRKNIRKYQKEYYEGEKRPFKEIGDIIRYYIRLRYGSGEGSITKFIKDLMDLNITQDKDLVYHWVGGYRKPRVDSLNRISTLLSISEEDSKNLEDLLNNNYRRGVTAKSL